MVVTLPSTGDAKRIIQTARNLNPHLHLIIRSRFISDMQSLYDLGADEVIPEEFETSIEIFTRMLAKYLIPRDTIEKLVAEVRADGYQMFRSLSLEDDTFSNLKVEVPEVEIHSIHVCENALLVDKNINVNDFTEKYKLTPLAVSRGQEILSLPSRDFRFKSNDILFLLGPASKVAEILSLFRTSEEGEKC
jgi:CPA2 family monovalent cation:H+ antiporter-2